MLTNPSRRGSAITSPAVPATRGVRATQTAPLTKREIARRRIVTLVFIVFWLLIFEGALRKWAFPSIQKVIFFIRDPFVLAIYFLAFKHKLWPKPSPLFVVGIGLAMFFIPLAFIQGLASNVASQIVIYGWRNYFYYLPLVFLIGEHFRGRDLARLVRQQLWVAIPIALLCYQQFRSPADDIVNQDYNQAATHMFVGRGIVRTSGTFTISTAQTLYIGSVAAMLFAAWLLPRRFRPIRPLGLWLATAACLTMIAVSGARSSWVTIAPILIAGLLSVVLMRQKRVNWARLATLPILVVAGGFSYVWLFPLAFGAMQERFQTGGSLIDRIVGPFISFFSGFGNLSLIGFGVGAFSNAGLLLLTGARTLVAEDELSRIIMECGIFGVLYISYRFWLTGALFMGAVKSTKRSRNPLPLLLIAFESIILLIGQMTMQGTVNGFGFLFAGFCMAANKLGTRKIAQNETKSGVRPWD